MKTIKIPLGPNASLDGGPFFSFQGVAVEPEEIDPSEGVIVGYDQEDNERTHSVDEIQRHIRNEMEASEPVNVDTGGVRGGNAVGCIRVPLWPGYTVEVFDDKTPEKDLSDLSGYSERTIYEKRLQRHGGAIHG